jgi:hypothetical protein
MREHACCYYECPEEGTIHIGANGGDSHWICWVHYYRWNADRARFLADGGCEMEKLGDPGRRVLGRYQQRGRLAAKQKLISSAFLLPAGTLSRQPDQEAQRDLARRGTGAFF